jgi:uncharacterized protein (TIGR02118 family)
MVAIFKVPNDVESFDKYYQEIHTPLTKKVPGIKEFRVSKVFGTPRGKSDIHLITEIVFMQEGSVKFHKTIADLRQTTVEKKISKAIANVLRNK